ncbi:hypothetical protein [Gelidibacter salicanalis]|uniref:GH26 domain-containing protein n=1 Tax=Gelidibacter salicanalis TaxID=291193 RepID=A0A934NHS9_9FLAO|nr:hypothetical protein [Gelidibacter salicanalis]MBJ7880183.1 hypothetical protein [Gelidibacter salicanalis]
MKKIFLYILTVGALLLLIGYLAIHFNIISNLFGKDNTLKANLSVPIAEVSFTSETPFQTAEAFSHFTLKLYNKKQWPIQKEALAQIPEHTPVMITVETWAKKHFTYGNNPLSDVVNGKYDKILQKMCTDLIGNRSNIYFRFNPEMEVPVKLYPWQLEAKYIEAFQHFSKLCKTYAPQAKIVWAPASYPGAMEYYPGDEFVDAATVTLNSASEKLLQVYPNDYPIHYDIMRRVHRLRFIDKPIFVLGSNPSVKDAVNDQLFAELSTHIRENRDIIYSNDNFQRFELDDELEQQRHIEIGLYDPQSLLNEEKPVTVEHLFADFSNLSNGSFQESFNNVEKREHDIIVTFEPFRNTNGETDLNVLQQVTKGEYDKDISHLYDIILATKRKVYLRYAHEMEIPITRYPWQSQNPVDYIKSFRYFMNFKNPLPSNIKRVWGPAGDRGSIEWWPGNDVVDYISIAIYGLPDKNITDPKKQETFATIFKRKYRRMRFINKPIFITEFGVKGPEDFQTNWLEDAAKVIRKHEQIIGVNYFNMSDTPKAWGDIKPPDWSISKKTFYHFIEVLEKDL